MPNGSKEPQMCVKRDSSKTNDMLEGEFRLIVSFPLVFESGGSMLSGRCCRNRIPPEIRQHTILVTGSSLEVQDQMRRCTAATGRARIHGADIRLRRLRPHGGAHCQLEMPVRKLADIIAAAEFAHTLTFTKMVGHLYDGLSVPKKLGWMDGSQVDFYDQPHLVDPAVEAVSNDFEETL